MLEPTEQSGHFFSVVPTIDCDRQARLAQRCFLTALAEVRFTLGFLPSHCQAVLPSAGPTGTRFRAKPLSPVKLRSLEHVCLNYVQTWARTGVLPLTVYCWNR